MMSIVNASPTKTLDNASVPDAREAEPDERCQLVPAKRTETAMTVFGPPGVFSRRTRQKTASGGANQIEEIDAVDPLDGFGDHE